MNNSFASRLNLIILTFGVFIAVGPATSAVLWTANNGTDNATCGSRASPCRSISQTMANAAAGDTIEVGPGHYGDLSGGGTFGGPGDEQPSTIIDPFFQDMGCIVCITKPLKIYSLSGAALTIIEGKSDTFQTTVLIASEGVVFGDKDKGFTISGGNVNGLLVFHQQPNTTKNVYVTGNIDLNDGTGFTFFGRDYKVAFCPPDIGCTYTNEVFFSSNQAIGNMTGFSVSANFNFGGQVILQNNSALNAGVGFWVAPGFQCDGICPNGLSAGIALLQYNVVAHSGIGFIASLSGPLLDNTAIANSQTGFFITAGPAVTFQHNSAIGNDGPGVIMVWLLSAEENGEPTSAIRAFDENNFIGNDRNRPVLTVGNFRGPFPIQGSSAHCGILFLGAIATFPDLTPPFPIENFLAAKNYWGSPGGPSASGGGDTSGGACDQNNGVTKTAPFSTTAFGIAAP
jgi:hypothetical protein